MKFIDLIEVQDSDLPLVGAKALSLAKMKKSGISVPNGLIITTNHFNSYLDENDLKIKIENLLRLVDLEKNQSLNDSSAKITELILSGIILDKIKDKIKEVFLTLDTKFVAVRSSAVMEDGKEDAWAGQFESFLNVGEDKLIDYIKQCWASLFSPRALYYKITKKHTGDNWGMAVLIQKMINSDSSGVAFSVHPQTKNDKHIYIESCFGLGEALVSGAVIPDSFTIHKDTLELLDLHVAQKDSALFSDNNGDTKWNDILPEKATLRSLSNNQLKKLAETIKKLEKYFNLPCDVEWAYELGNLHILQCRPVTALRAIKPEQQGLKKGFTSIINWLGKTDEHADIINDAIAYDNKKAERLTFLNETTGLPINITHVLPLDNFDLKNEEIIKIIEGRGGSNVQHAFRVAPKEGHANIFDVQKHYGLTFTEFAEKLKELQIPKDMAEVRITNFRGSPLAYSAIILVTKEGIIGEVVNDDLYVLTYMDSVKEGKCVTQFYKTPNSPLCVMSKDSAVVEKVNYILDKLAVGQSELALNNEGFETSDGYIVGYFEYVEGKNGDCAFTDMNTKKIANNISIPDAIRQLRDYNIGEKNTLTDSDDSKIIDELKGLVVYKNYPTIEGLVVLFKDDLEDFPDDIIFVSSMTTVDHLPFMKKARAVITDFGGLMSHPAIISRELKIPTVVGTRNATKILKDGDRVVIDMETGIIKIKLD